MKLKFNKDTAIEVLNKEGETYSKSFRRGDVIRDEIDSSFTYPGGAFFNILLENEEILLDVPKSAVTVIE